MLKSAADIDSFFTTGKTTLVKRISERLGASILQTPPGHIRHLRDCFDRQPPLIRRAYYTVGNYLVAGDVRQTCIRTPVIMDRYDFCTLIGFMAICTPVIMER